MKGFSLIVYKIWIKKSFQILKLFLLKITRSIHIKEWLSSIAHLNSKNNKIGFTPNRSTWSMEADCLKFVQSETSNRLYIIMF